MGIRPVFLPTGRTDGREKIAILTETGRSKDAGLRRLDWSRQEIGAGSRLEEFRRVSRLHFLLEKRYGLKWKMP
jgi:hypothetical protein